MKVRYKRCIRIFFLCFFAAIIAVISLVAVVDPFFHYHKPLKNVYYIIDNQLSQNPGIAKNFEYDSVILGSSMTVNFDTNLFAETMGLNTVKLSYNSAYPKDNDNIMQLVQQSDNEIKEIFLGIDIYTYKAPPGIVAYGIPEYLYDDALFNDAFYLLNKDVLLDYILLPQVKREGTALNEAYWVWQKMVYSEAMVAEIYEPPSVFSEMLPEDTYRDNIEENMQKYILPYIESMPDTKFTVFFPPYSVLYWYGEYADGNLAAELAGERQIMELLFSYPNVRVYYFQDMFDFITDLDNYCDHTHYIHEMNDQMTIWFSQEDCPYEVTPENYGAVLDEMKEWLDDCDFESYLPYEAGFT